MTEKRTQPTELVLGPGEYAYAQDLTTGNVKVHCGPTVLNTTGQDFPVEYNRRTSKIARVDLLDAANQSVVAAQGQYVVLENPSENGDQPEESSKSNSRPLLIGQKQNIAGPATFALWPRQTATIIDGHRLRSNQYLVTRIVDGAAAKANWGNSVIKAAATDVASDAQEVQTMPKNLNDGTLDIICGTEVSFYIPPTGIEVVPDGESYVRDAVTLERLEYCVLQDEDGNKRYERGPQVVFPKPTEKFFAEQDKSKNRHVVFKPIELNAIQALHIKVIAAYTEDGVEHKEGDELFIKGTDTAIYFPRQEHSFIAYDGKQKHFSTAIPEGEGRYVLQRTTGQIRKEVGPQMLLPDPRTEVIVRRVLEDRQCMIWYPGNEEARKYNTSLRGLARNSPGTRNGVSEGQITRSRSIRQPNPQTMSGSPQKSLVHSDSLAFGAAEFERGANYQQPRTVTLDTKFSGVPTINVFTGYAVMVVDKRGGRRVEVGPKQILLEYDESLETLTMSTGKPKTTDSLLSTAYLRIKNNQISDLVKAETKDHVSVTVKVSLRVNFEGESSKWFDAENYVKLLTDHVRSVVRSDIRRRTLDELYSKPEELVRSAILGAKSDGKRPGMSFAENGMHLIDVEVLDFQCGDPEISRMLFSTQQTVVESNIGLELSRRELEVTIAREKLTQQRDSARQETIYDQNQLRDELAQFTTALKSKSLDREAGVELKRIALKAKELEERSKNREAEQKMLDEDLRAEVSRQKLQSETDIAIQSAQQKLKLDFSAAQTAETVKRFEAGAGPFADAVTLLGNHDLCVKIAEATSMQNVVGGDNFVDAATKVFAGTPLADFVESTVAKTKTAPGRAAIAAAKSKRN